MDMENKEHFFWENFPSPADYEKELKKIRKSIRKRNALIVLTSLILAAALLLGTIHYGIPTLESRYWDPRTVSFGTAEGTDFDMLLAAYTDLFSPTTYFHGSRITHTGFASYSITVAYRNELTYENLESYATLEKGELFVPFGVWDTVSHNMVGSYWSEAADEIPEVIKQQRQFAIQQLTPLPDYIRVAAYVTFKEDKTLMDVFRFRDELINASHDWYNDTAYYWTAIRHADEMDNSARCGFASDSFTDQFPEANEQYPAFSERQAYEDRNISYEQWSSKEKTYTAHFKSLLKFMDDQLKNGTGIPAPPSGTGEVDMDYYANALAYVEEHGLMAYGCYIVGSPQHLLEIMEREDVLVLIPTEEWLYI